MLKEETLKTLSKMFIGDLDEFYRYKKGNEIVDFFNHYFDFKDVYGAGFKTRWVYTAEKLQYLYDNNLDDFFNIILSREFVVRDLDTDDPDTFISRTLDLINKTIFPDGFRVYKTEINYRMLSSKSNLRLVDEGGFARVYLDESEDIIVKCLKEEYKSDKSIKSRFGREFSLTQSLSDIDGVINVYSFNKIDYSYSMEKADHTMEEYIKDYFLGDKTKKDTVLKILRIMDKVHDRNIVHRDLTPNNILIVEDTIKISDFGLGKNLSDVHSHLTDATHSLGQYWYCAPEQLKGLKDGDKRSDVYSLGRIINYIYNKSPEVFSHRFRTVTEKACNKNPDWRFQNAGEILEEVEKILYHYEVSDKVEEKIRRQSPYDKDIADYISERNGYDLCRIIVNLPMTKYILRYLDEYPDRAEEITGHIESNYLEVCRDWVDYDRFSSIAEGVVLREHNYVIKERFSKILYEIAYSKNRFNAQHRIEDILKIGIEPTIEEILKGQ